MEITVHTREPIPEVCLREMAVISSVTHLPMSGMTRVALFLVKPGDPHHEQNEGDATHYRKYHGEHGRQGVFWTSCKEKCKYKKRSQQPTYD
jgi:hypothetical protein